MQIRILALVIAALVLGSAAVAVSPSAADDSDRSITVFAAASLTTAFRAVGAAFEAQHPSAKVTFNFAGSPTLVRQILDGAPADVFASADEANMQRLSEERALGGEPVTFVRNRLQIVVAKGNPKHVAGLADLARADLTVVFCGATVPAGRYALDAFARAGMQPPAGSRELDVKAVVSKVELGEADAGVVYVTDVRAAAPAVDGVDIAESHNVVARYPIALIAAAHHRDEAHAFIAFVRSPAGQKILADLGFLPP
jgi:molybdate transport system substrate-binding protein